MTFAEFERLLEREKDSYAFDEPEDDVYERLAFTEKLIRVARAADSYVQSLEGAVQSLEGTPNVWRNLTEALKEVGL